MRPFYPVQQRVNEYIAGVRSVRAYRLVTYLRYTDRKLGSRLTEVLIDTGAPFSVIPYDIWTNHNLELVDYGSALQKLEKGNLIDVADQAKWLNVPCNIGELQVSLVDEDSLASRRLTLVAKLPRHAVNPKQGSVFILGQHFFAFNNLSLLVNPRRPFALDWPNASNKERGQVPVVGWIEVPMKPADDPLVSLEPGSLPRPVAPGPMRS